MCLAPVLLDFTHKTLELLDNQCLLFEIGISLITRHAAPVAAGRLLIIDYLVDIASRC